MGGSDSEGLPVDKFFRALIDLRATELVMQTGQPASFRIKGEPSPLDMPPIDEATMRELCWPLMDEQTQAAILNRGIADIVHIVEYKGAVWKFHASLLFERGTIRLIVRQGDRVK